MQKYNGMDTSFEYSEDYLYTVSLI